MYCVCVCVVLSHHHALIKTTTNRYSLVVKQEPNNARANAGLGSALATEGRNEEAVQYLERGAKLDPTLIPILRDSMIALYNRLQLKFPSRVEFVEGLRKWEGEGEG